MLALNDEQNFLTITQAYSSCCNCNYIRSPAAILHVQTQTQRVWLIKPHFLKCVDYKSAMMHTRTSTNCNSSNRTYISWNYYHY